MIQEFTFLSSDGHSNIQPGLSHYQAQGYQHTENCQQSSLQMHGKNKCIINCQIYEPEVIVPKLVKV